MNNIAILLTLAVLASVSHALVMDYCVGDLSLPMGPEGYACKDTANVTVDDFVYTGFRKRGPTNAIFGNSITLAFADAFPGINGQGISMARLDFDVGGVVPLHTHRSSEVIIIAQGTIIAGFIDTTNVAYYKKLQVGDVMIFPQGLQHFQVNVGKTPALAFVSLNSANPSVQIVDTQLFNGNLPSELVEKTMLLDHEEVEKLKKAFAKFRRH